MTRDGVLPGLEHLVIICLFTLDASLVLDLGEFGSTFIVHAILEVTAHGAVSLTYLTKNISLMRLFIERIGQSLLLMSFVHRFYLSFNDLLIVSFQPCSLLSQLLLQQDIPLTVLIHVL